MNISIVFSSLDLTIYLPYMYIYIQVWLPPQPDSCFTIRPQSNQEFVWSICTVYINNIRIMSDRNSISDSWHLRSLVHCSTRWIWTTGMLGKSVNTSVGLGQAGLGDDQEQQMNSNAIIFLQTSVKKFGRICFLGWGNVDTCKGHKHLSVNPLEIPEGQESSNSTVYRLSLIILI